VVRAFKNRAIEFAALTGDEFLRLAAEEPDVRAVLVMDISKGADALIGKTEQSLKELCGKKIGVEVNALGVYMLTRALSVAGLKKDQVQIVPLENDQHVTAFYQGRVDALVTFEPHRSKLLKQGGRVLFDSSRISGEVVAYLVTRESLLRDRPEAVKTIISGWFKARERLLNEGDQAARLVASREGVTPAEFLESLDLLEIPSLEKNRQMLAEKGKAANLIASTYQMMIQNGLLHGSVPTDKLFNGGFLP